MVSRWLHFWNNEFKRNIKIFILSCMAIYSRQVNTYLWWNRNRPGRRQSAGPCYIWTDIYRRGAGRGQIPGFALQNFPCKPDQRSVKEDKGERRMLDAYQLPHTVICGTAMFYCQSLHLTGNPITLLLFPGPPPPPPPLCPPSIGALGEVWVLGGNTGHGLWVGAACLYPTDYSTSPPLLHHHRPPPVVGGANLPWKRLRARSRHEALIRHSPEWVLRTINL